MKMRLSAWLALLAHAVHASSRETAAHFGPGGCVSAWLSESKSCVVQTSCAKHVAQLASYALRLVCVGHDGGRVLHSFQEGTFDAEETFDTHITCQRCDSGDDVTATATIAPTAATAPTETTALAKERNLVTVNASELQGLEEEVQLLKSSMVSMAKVVAQLKLQVNDSNLRGFRGSAVSTGTAAAPPVAPAAPVPKVPKVPKVPNGTHALPVLHAPIEINTTFFLRKALGASANVSNVTTSTTRSIMAESPAAPMRASGSGALNPAAAAAARTLRKRGASFLGLDRADFPAAQKALAASVAAAQREAEEAALQAEKDAEADALKDIKA